MPVRFLMCPCELNPKDKCNDSCSCACPVMSYGCDNYAKYGSLEQQIAAAEKLFKKKKPPSTS